MKKRLTAGLMSLVSALTLACAPRAGTDPVVSDVRVLDERNLSVQEYTVANIASTDALGRTVRTGDLPNGDEVGIFYFAWNGYHTQNQTDVYDITKLLESDPDAFWSLESNEKSPLDEYHYWGEPLYGYYYGSDPWVIARHVELFTMAGIDYLLFDVTNAYTYPEIAQAVFEVLDIYYRQGWNVPKAGFYTNSHSSETVRQLYNKWYKTGLYEDLWYKIDGKPLLVTDVRDFSLEEEELYSEIFYIKESQWPQDPVRKNGFPWMSWEYPQTIFDGAISCSIAQHPSCHMSLEGRDNCNYGRGFNRALKKNEDDRADEGINFDSQWDTVFKNRDSVHNVFITGWNEWIALKQRGETPYSTDSVFTVDTFNKAYSRDIEMMKGGYGDNYYLQMASYIKQFKYTEPKHYKYSTATVNIEDTTFADFEVGAHYKDFAQDAVARNYRGAAKSLRYTDTSNRNDVTDVKVIHDGEYAYFYVQTTADITEHEEGDLSWMNVLIKTSDDVAGTFGGYAYAINRKPQENGKTSVEKSTGGYNFTDAGEAEYRVYGNVMLIKVPLAAIGISADAVTFQFKVSDHVVNGAGTVENLDISDYYVTGDSAPIGRLSYSYGY